jgi:hypothetical protein
MADYSIVFNQPASNPVNYNDYPDWERTETAFNMTTTGTGIGSVGGLGYDSFVYTGISSAASRAKIVIDSYDQSSGTTGLMINATYNPVYLQSSFLLVTLLPNGALGIFVKNPSSNVVNPITNGQGGGSRNTDTVAWAAGDELEIIVKQVGEYTTVTPIKNGTVYDGWTIASVIAGDNVPTKGSCGVYAYNDTIPNFRNAIRSFEVTDVDKEFQLYPDTFLLRTTLNLVEGYFGAGATAGIVGFFPYPLDIIEGVPSTISDPSKEKFLQIFGANLDITGNNILTLMSHSPITNPITNTGPQLQDQIRSLHLTGNSFCWSIPVPTSNPSFYVNNTYNFLLADPWTVDYGDVRVGELVEIIVEVDASFLGLSGGGGGSGGGGDITPRHFAETLTGEKI